MTDAAQTTIALTLSGERNLALTLTRDQFTALGAPLVQRTIGPMRKALRDAGMGPDDVKGVVLVGGATRMPQVRAAVATFFGREPLIDLDPDQVVALGAAVQANLLAGNQAEGDDWLLLDVIPLSLGVETMGGLVEKIIPRNATIPVARAQEFTTFKDGQTAMAVHVLQGERELASDCRSLARFELRGIPPMTAGAARIRVTYQADADGLLSVSAQALHSGVAASIEVKPSYGMADDDISRMLQDSFGSAEADMRARALREQQVEAERLLVAIDSALQADPELLDADERAQIDGLLAELRQKASGDDQIAIKTATETLSHATDAFAARRMDKSIRAALAGRRVADIDKL